ncbi:MAG: ribosome maturation factor RimM [Proteobacteria bacterium]|nr:ribosome maturation factor RimM [Pseudomonadota bacterium]
MVADLVVIGRVTQPHGVQGELRIRPYTESIDSFDLFHQVYLRRPGGVEELADVVGARPHKDLVLVKIKGIRSRDQAEALAGAELLVRREWLPSLEPDEYYWVDLIGLDVYDQADHHLGRVRNILSTQADDLLVVVDDDREVLLPFRDEIVRDVDLEAGRLRVSPPEGLLE